MADYKGIKGFKVQSLASDPSNVLNGEVWYNTTSAALKLGSQGSAGWASGGNLNTGRQNTAGIGSQTAAMMAGGYLGGVSPVVSGNAVEEYDGTSWTATPALNTDKAQAGSTGTTTSGLVFGGDGAPPVGPGVDDTESWNGSAWTETANLNLGRYGGAALGASNTSALYAGGQIVPTPRVYVCETWNGTSWTEGNNIINGRKDITGVGIVTAGIIAGGNYDPPVNYVTDVETYDGTCWTAGTAIPTADASMGCSAQGTTTAAMFFGGTTPSGTGGYIWNGSAWTTAPTMGSPHYNLRQMCGTQTLALCAGSDPSGPNPPICLATEEYSDPAPIDTKTVTIS